MKITAKVDTAYYTGEAFDCDTIVPAGTEIEVFQLEEIDSTIVEAVLSDGTKIAFNGEYFNYLKMYVVFYENEKPVCGTWVTADSEDIALELAEFKAMCMIPNVKYDSLAVTERK